MPVPTTITDLSTTAASNYPQGTDSPSTLDDTQRAHGAFIRQLQTGAVATTANVTAGTITGATINNTSVGATTPASGAFTTLSATGNVTLGDASTDTLNVGNGDLIKDASGNLGLGVTPSAWNSAAKAFQVGAIGAVYHLSNQTHLGNNVYNNSSGTNTALVTGYSGVYQIASNGSHLWYTTPSTTTAGTAITFTQAMTLDASGNLLVGITSGSYHRLMKSVAEGSVVGAFTNETGGCYFYGANTGGANAAATVVGVDKNTTTSRSINAAGTINASGADYAEYEHNNGLTIAKGDVVGFKADGTLTLTFSEAVRFGIKSTNPSYVGGDTWGSEDAVGKRPEQPVRKVDVTETVGEGEAAVTTVLEAGDTDEEWQAKQDKYAADLAAFEAALEAARQLVDRIAYCGKVPCNVTGATPGGYIIAVDNAGVIAGEFVADPDFAQYKKAVGRVNRILPDGRAEVAVIVH